MPAGYLTDDAEREVISLAKEVVNVSAEIPADRVFDNRFIKQVEKELKGWMPQIPR